MRTAWRRYDSAKGDTTVPRGPNGQKRPADAIGCAVMVARIATGEEGDSMARMPGRMRSGQAGAMARNMNLSEERRLEIAKKAAQARWK